MASNRLTGATIKAAKQGPKPCKLGDGGESRMARDFIEALIERAESAHEGNAAGLDPTEYPQRSAALELYRMFVDAVMDEADPDNSLNVDP